MKKTGENNLKHRRILVKISGEALVGRQSYGIDPQMVEYVAEELQEVAGMGVQVAVVVGGGNIFRGLKASTEGMDRVTGDQMGMLATVINALALQDFIERRGLQTRVLSAINVSDFAEPFIRRRAIRHLEKDRIVIFAAGTGNPFFSTDTAAALRAIEIKAEIILKGTKVDGVYDYDPVERADAVMYKSVTHLEVVKKRLKVMDSTAVTLSMDNRIPLRVFNLNTPGNIKRIVLGEDVGTLVST